MDKNIEKLIKCLYGEGNENIANIADVRTALTTVKEQGRREIRKEISKTIKKAQKKMDGTTQGSVNALDELLTLHNK